MTLEQFAEQYRVRIRRDSCGEEIISGKKFCHDMPKRVEYHSHIYDNGDGRFGVCLLSLTPGKWTHAKKRVFADGFTLGQDGDTEGRLTSIPPMRSRHDQPSERHESDTAECSPKPTGLLGLSI
jgi:hypothetical protein